MACRRTIYNTYGPTETTVVATVADVRPKEPVTFGRPIPNYTCYVVNDKLELLRPGLEGELLIGGPGVAGGYLQREEMTTEKFIANPFGSDGPDPILYRSGDAVVLDESGNLSFRGRIDDQIKIRGFRVELGEIEAVLSTQRHVRFRSARHPQADDVAATYAARDKPARDRGRQDVHFAVGKAAFERHHDESVGGSGDAGAPVTVERATGSGTPDIEPLAIEGGQASPPSKISFFILQRTDLSEVAKRIYNAPDLHDICLFVADDAIEEMSELRHDHPASASRSPSMAPGSTLN